jgi:hypothetical protein
MLFISALDLCRGMDICAPTPQMPSQYFHPHVRTRSAAHQVLQGYTTFSGACIIAALVTVACGGQHSATKARLKSPMPLTRQEIAPVLEAVGRAIAARVPRVRQGAVTRPLDERERAQLFDVLADAGGLEDVGLRTMGGVTLRGLRSPATSPQSEIEATGTVWIDVGTLLPRRYEFAYAMPGFGDFGYDLTFEP